ncbi:hypothetical protein KDU71_22385 [Carboxylicivirga sediminis]|uniref:NigD-like C-terminal beta sandwich domain-containing protein n=1 Tax=Carboxylicivirga sediminis TaxID=2006564 RepID=A0A941IYW9_9BACT|nr:hypothetical protein [Carboxylicivirga sediminis]MBR8538336.1 hypothetical protein [Carboxylicivirga sediminis]
MKFLHAGMMAALAAMLMVSCSSDDDTIKVEDPFAGIVVMAETANYDGETIVSVDGVIYQVVENVAVDDEMMADYAWFVMEYVPTPEVGDGINVRLTDINYTQVEEVIEADMVDLTDSGVEVEAVVVEGTVLSLNLNYVGGDKVQLNQLAYDADAFEANAEELVLTLVHDSQKDKATSELSYVAEFDLSSIEQEVTGAKLIINYINQAGEEVAFDTEIIL